MQMGCTTKPGVWFLAVLTCERKRQRGNQQQVAGGRHGRQVGASVGECVQLELWSGGDRGSGTVLNCEPVGCQQPQPPPTTCAASTAHLMAQHPPHPRATKHPTRPAPSTQQN